MVQILRSEVLKNHISLVSYFAGAALFDTAFWSNPASLPECCKAAVSSPPPMLEPPMNTFGTVDLPVKELSAD